MAMQVGPHHPFRAIGSQETEIQQTRSQKAIRNRPVSYRLRAIRTSHALAIMLCVLWLLSIFNAVGLAQESLLVRVNRPDGTPSPLLSKVVVTSDNAVLVAKPGATQGEIVPAFTIYHRLKSDDGLLEVRGRDGIPYWRVGDSSGKSAGWIKRLDRITVDGNVTDTPVLREWNSRFVLDPIEGQELWPENERFRIIIDDKTPATLNALAAGQKRYAFVTGTPEGDGVDEVFPVVVYAGKTEGRNVRASGGEILEDLGLEIAFVLESTDFMQAKFEDNTLLKEYVHNIVREMLREIESRGKLKERVRIAIIEYQDSQDSDKVKFVKRVTQKLTNSKSEIEAALSRFEGTVIGGDWPEDGIAGLYAAINELDWDPNSCKHVVLVGFGALQEKPKGRQDSEYGGEYNFVTKVNDKYGWSSTGLDTRGIIAAAHPSGGQDVIERVLRRKTLHALRIDRRPEALPNEFLRVRDEVVKYDDERVLAFAGGLIEQLGDEEGKGLLRGVFNHYLAEYQRNLASSQYKRLAANDSRAQGFFDETEATPEGVKSSTQKLLVELERALEEYDKLARNEFTTSNQAGAEGAFTQSLYTIADAALREKLARDPALAGKAETRNASGREVAQLRVLVSRKELEVLKSRMDAIQKKFESRTKMADRQNVDDILEDLQEAIAAGASGQAVTASADLQELITDLPLKTQCLRTTAADIAAMSPEEFTNWLSQISYAVKRCSSILDSSDEWVSIGAGVAEEFAFLRRDELP